MKKIFLVFALIFMTASILFPQNNSTEKLDMKEAVISLLRNTAFGGFFLKAKRIKLKRWLNLKRAFRKNTK